MSARQFPAGSICACSVALPDGTKASANVRVLDHRDGSMVYVHYLGNDARLDEWISSSRLSKLSGAAEEEASGGDQHVRKRKHSTISARGDLAVSDSEDGDHRSRKIWHHGAGHDHEHTKVRNVQRVQLGEHLIDAWYFSPYPPPYDKYVERLYVCDVTFKYMKSPKVFARHQAKVEERPVSALKPPGEEVYRDDILSVFRVEGTEERLYCQNLCLLGKLFIEHKTLHYDPTPFFFFVVTERYLDAKKRERYRPVGYFSKEKESENGYNLACILTLPPYQRKGYGRFIISLSYEISKREGKVGSPEKPLSDLGKLSYRKFWSCQLLSVLRQTCETGKRPDVKDLSQQTGIRVEDTVSTLQALGLIKHLRGSLVLAVSRDAIDQLLEPFITKRFADAFCKPEALLVQWTKPDH